jgi:hypothetical protein
LEKAAISDSITAIVEGSTIVIAVLIFMGFGILVGNYSFIFATYCIFIAGALVILTNRTVKIYMGGSEDVKKKLIELDQQVNEDLEYHQNEIRRDLKRDVQGTKNISRTMTNINPDVMFEKSANDEISQAMFVSRQMGQAKEELNGKIVEKILGLEQRGQEIKEELEELKEEFNEDRAETLKEIDIVLEDLDSDEPIEEEEIIEPIPENSEIINE